VFFFFFFFRGVLETEHQMGFAILFEDPSWGGHVGLCIEFTVVHFMPDLYSAGNHQLTAL